MCGFAGILGHGSFPESMLQRMGAAIAHRGPDDSGIWCDENAGIALVHRRLSILDLSPAGHQPMHSSSGRYTIAFNGEIYNHLTLRKAMKERVWCGHSDTETLLEGFETWGIQSTIQRAVGMFAFAIWDKKERTLTLARDRIGEKPLYYGWQKRGQNSRLLFGSELKALREYQGEFEIDRDALAAFMRYSYIPAPQSIYQGIRKLMPGTLMTVRADKPAELEIVSYWSFPDIARNGIQKPFEGTDTEALDGLETRLSEAVSIQQISDVPIGAFLSGGIDSSTIVSLMQAQSSRPIHTFTIGFNDEQYDEAVYAKSVAQHLGTYHTDLYITPEEARAVIPRLPRLYDEPFADSSQIPTFLISQLARQSVKVCLSGDAGDELFGGYNRYAWARKLTNMPASLRHMVAAGLRLLSPAQWDRLYSMLELVIPTPLRFRMPGDKMHKLAPVLAFDSDVAVYQQLVSTWTNPDKLVINGHDNSNLLQTWEELSAIENFEHRMMALDAMTYLPDDILCKVDRAAMGVSLETRIPFLDTRVVEFAWHLPLEMKLRNGQGKWILRQLLYKYIPKKLIERPKMGFGVPIDAWLRGPLREWGEDLLNESRLKQENYFNPAQIRKKWIEHQSGKRNWQHQLWNVLMFQAWLMEQV